MEFINQIPADEWKMSINESGIHWFIIDWNASHQEIIYQFKSLIEENGILMQFGEHLKSVFIHEDYYYWITKSGRFKNFLINRAKVSDLADYVNVDDYENIFDHTFYINEDRILLNMIGELKGSVLDIGCGTGALYENKVIENYTGIDPSPIMLKRFAERHPNVRTSLIITKAENLVKLQKTYDNVIAIFSGSYVSEIEIFKKLWSGNGTMFLMFYKENYTPVAHQLLKIIPRYQKWTKSQLDEHFHQSVMEFNNYYIVSL